MHTSSMADAADLYKEKIILVQIVFSVLWLKYYNYGPAEWLLRRLSYGKRLPGKIRRSVENETVTPVVF